MIVVSVNFGTAAPKNHGAFQKINWFPKGEFAIFLCIVSVWLMSKLVYAFLQPDEANQRLRVSYWGVSRDPPEQRSFYEANHLDSDIDMVGVIRNLLLEEQKRQKTGDSENEIFIRPDHGHQIR